MGLVSRRLMRGRMRGWGRVGRVGLVEVWWNWEGVGERGEGLISIRRICGGEWCNVFGIPFWIGFGLLFLCRSSLFRASAVLQCSFSIDVFIGCQCRLSGHFAVLIYYMLDRLLG